MSNVHGSLTAVFLLYKLKCLCIKTGEKKFYSRRILPVFIYLFLLTTVKILSSLEICKFFLYSLIINSSLKVRKFVVKL